MADHNPMPEVFDDWRMLRSELPRYVDMVLEARTSLAPFPVKLGLECDWLPHGEGWIEELATFAPWDFLIGSVHYLEPGWAVDNPATSHRIRADNLADIWSCYTQAQVACIRSGLFDILGHADLVKKFGHHPPGDPQRYYDPVIEALADSRMAFEINTAGLYRAAGETYPAPLFIQLALEAGIPVVISSDAHDPAHVGRDFDHVLEMLRTAGCTRTGTFHNRALSFEDL